MSSDAARALISARLSSAAAAAGARTRVLRAAVRATRAVEALDASNDAGDLAAATRLRARLLAAVAPFQPESVVDREVATVLRDAERALVGWDWGVAGWEQGEPDDEESPPGSGVSPDLPPAHAAVPEPVAVPEGPNLARADLAHVDDMPAHSEGGDRFAPGGHIPMPPSMARDSAVERAMRARRKSSKGYRRAVAISIISWLMAVAGLVLALGFLIAAFASSERNPILQVDFDEAEELPLPVFTVCPRMLDTPLFLLGGGEENKNLTGLPIVTVARFENTQTGEIVFWPEAVEKFSLVALGPSTEDCNDRLSTLVAGSATFFGEFISTNRTSKSCSQCIRYGIEKPTVLSASISARASNSSSGSAAVRDFSGIRIDYAVSRLYAFCAMEDERATTSGVHLLFPQEFFAQVQVLRNRGIISDPSGSANFSSEGVFEYPNDITIPGDEFTRKSWIDFNCNVYFNSGVFYEGPSPQSDIGFIWNDAIKWWERNETKKGPWFDAFPAEAANAVDSDPTLDLRPTSADDTGFSILSTTGLDMYAEDFTVVSEKRNETLNVSTFVGTVDRHADVTFRLRRSKSNEEVYEYTAPTRLVSLTRPLFSYEQAYSYNRIELEFDRFLTESFDTTKAFPLGLFIADLLNYISLFTGFSFYSVLVAPATLYLSHRAIRQAAMRPAQQ